MSIELNHWLVPSSWLAVGAPQGSPEEGRLVRENGASLFGVPFKQGGSEEQA